MNLNRTLLFTLFFAFIFPLTAQQWGNYTLVSLQGQSTAKLIDTLNATYHTYTPGSGSSAYSAFILPGGEYIRSISVSNPTFTGGGMTGGIQKVDWNNNVTWQYNYSTPSYSMHHDFCPMPNGNVLLIAYELKTASEVTQAGSSTSHIMWPDKIVEVQPNGATGGTVVWEWHAWDHLVQSVDATKDNFGVVAEHPELLNINYNNNANTKDWMHANGIDYNPLLDQIILSSHNLNEFYVIDHSTTTVEAASHQGGNSGHGGDILYRWGNPAAYGASGTNIFHTVHDAHWIPENYPNAGYMVGYNNNGISNNQSSVEFVAPPYAENYSYSHTAGSAFSPSTYTLRHACSGHNNNMGSSQSLPNGNLIVCVAQSGLIYEVNAAGTQLWSYTASGTMAQAFRYDNCYLTTPRPTVPTISLSGNVLTSSSATSYQWYLNGSLIPGATSQSYTPTQNGVYLVKVGEPNACQFNYSVGFRYSTILTTSNPSKSELSIYPNPANDIIQIAGIPSGASVLVSLFNMTGQLVDLKSNVTNLDVSFLPDGVYVIRATVNGTPTYSQKLLLAH
ncbi:MAG TPA: aryl-sulfate sulfotransferase [Flavobacteriales bacterium]|nr:aryl-sulfate sulfotransferase [Flavobacteriales bacterium]HPH81108.1 aryl-sulfate sulfotransferase [Flavobacteriales bacterium]